MATYQLIAATGCPTGIAHTYMAQEALEQAAKRKAIMAATLGNLFTVSYTHLTLPTKLEV